MRVSYHSYTTPLPLLRNYPKIRKFSKPSLGTFRRKHPRITWLRCWHTFARPAVAAAAAAIAYCPIGSLLSSSLSETSKRWEICAQLNLHHFAISAATNLLLADVSRRQFSNCFFLRSIDGIVRKISIILRKHWLIMSIWRTIFHTWSVFRITPCQQIASFVPVALVCVVGFLFFEQIYSCSKWVLLAKHTTWGKMKSANASTTDAFRRRKAPEKASENTRNHSI